MRHVVAVLFLALALPASAAAPSDEAFRSSYAREARGDAAGALAALEGVAERPELAYVLRLRRGWLLHLAGRHAEAVKAYATAIELQPRALEPRHGVLLPLMAERRWAEAETQAKAALAIAPQDVTALGKLGYVHASQLRYEEAEKDYRRALELFPSSVELRSGLGWALLRLRRLPEARAEFTAILAVAPDHPGARDGLAAIP